MNVFVDTSVWSLALRRAPAPRAPEVVLLDQCLERGDVIVTTGIVLQELLQGFQGPAQAQRIVKEFSLLPKFASGAAMCRERATLMALIFSITGPMSAPSE